MDGLNYTRRLKKKKYIIEQEKFTINKQNSIWGYTKMNNRDKEKLEDAINFIEGGIKSINLGLKIIGDYIKNEEK